MTARHVAPLLAVVLSAGLVLTGPAAHADRSVTEDAAADALSVTFTDADSDGTEEEVMAPAPEETAVDITRTVVQHRTHRLGVTVTFRDLQLGRKAFHLTAIRVVTPQASFWLNVDHITRRQGAATLERGARTIDCAGLRWSIDEDTDKVKASLPTACLGAPRWVQVGVGAVRVDAEQITPESEAMVIFADDGHRAGRMSEKSIAKGPKVFAG